MVGILFSLSYISVKREGILILSLPIREGILILFLSVNSLDRQTDRQTNRQTDRQIDRESDKQTDTVPVVLGQNNAI